MRTINYNVLSVKLKTYFESHVNRISYLSFDENIHRILSHQECSNLFNYFKNAGIIQKHSHKHCHLGVNLDYFTADNIRDIFLNNSIQCFQGKKSNPTVKPVERVCENPLANVPVEKMLVELNRRGFRLGSFKFNC